MVTRAANDNGFTLLEMLLVCAILSLLVSISLPRFSDTADALAGREASRSLASAIRYAEERSALEGKQVKLVLDGEEKSFTVVVPQRTEEQQRQQQEAPRAESLWSAPVELPPRVKFARVHGDEISDSDQKWELTFHPDGQISGCTIELETSKGRRYEVSIDGRTGRVTTRYVAAEEG